MRSSDDRIERGLGASELKVWFPGEYDAGYCARIQGTSESRTATACWQAGWQEADRELSSSCLLHAPYRDPPFVEDPECLSTFGSGASARSVDLPFEMNVSDAWKQSWIREDIELGSSRRK